ncbi:MAG: hypothetical protein JO173_03435, partial [Gammaproteobacteria bacterium]|nr:hypothetical protein [Gammaproteobacteria bacterium]
MRQRCSELQLSALLALLLAALPASGAGAAFDPSPWLEDLGEIRAAVATKYANLEWQVLERGLDLEEVFAGAQSRLHKATTEPEARAAIDQLTRAFADGQVH